MTNKEAREVLQKQIELYGQEYDDEGIEALNVAIKVLEIELLTDTEQRIFLRAISRERNVCQMVDDTYAEYTIHSNVSLVQICNSIERKVKKIWER